ncbi:flagellar biosynthetic protein FliO [Glaciecola sp. XM2]|jgi:flagellar protein FliO/FliZ|uniref:flagellar biosynthetic protein FliO n=1 Tax=Glaciecola sp. XM2 TaxID=1914931 RepID=UPI001BDDE327|nr:flagellar biosynthetic protein FliO [Glaciecola sp. XM2]MBT1450829.1 flagellar biosynthetic protein FliO [Glaciecola sp. XM2]
MLLVKSRELKSLNSYKIKNTLKTGCYALFLSSFWTSAHAQTASSEFGGMSSFISIFLSLMLVIAIIFALAYLMRRFNVTQAGNGQMKVVASMMAGAKEKIMVIEVGDEQHLVGITSHSINHLATLNNPIQSSSKSSAVDGKAGFQQKLVQAMAQSITGQNKKDKETQRD